MSMQARAEITGKYARVYTRASKKDKGRILDEVCAVTGWSRDNARRRLVAAAKRPPGRRKSAERRARARRYSYDALKVLQRVWPASGGQCGKYLKESMPLLLDLLEASFSAGAGTNSKALQSWWAQINEWRKRDCLAYDRESPKIKPQFVV